MKIKKIRVKNFRNIEECEIDFSDGVNLLYGNNAQGKTNIVEAIYLFSRGKSFRAREEKELIKFGEEGFYLYIDYESNIGRETLEYSLQNNERQRKKAVLWELPFCCCDYGHEVFLLLSFQKRKGHRSGKQRKKAVFGTAFLLL